MKALVDLHHADLLESMHRLFEDRLGMTVYVPYGMEWYDEGYTPYGSREVAKQFLVDAALHTDFHPRLIRFLPLDEFRGMDDFAVVVATMAEQQYGFKRLADEKGARFCVQVGNTQQFVDYSLDPFVFGAQGVEVHQEFDMDGAFAYAPVYLTPPKVVMSFVNIFPLLDGYPLFEAARSLLSGWTFRVYGHHGPDGFVKPTSAIAPLMAQSSFAWHDKETGDGFGHVIHQWAAVGRPLIGHGSYYRGQMAGWMWDDLVTCIDLDKHSVTETTRLMEGLVHSDRLEEMGETLSIRLRERVNFAADAQRVADALGLAVLA